MNRNIFKQMGQIQALSISIPIGAKNLIRLNLSWLIVLPLSVWAIGRIYLPIFGGLLNSLEIWSATIIIIILSGLSLLGHSLAHIAASRFDDNGALLHIPLYPLGDAAQVWPAASTAWKDSLVALAGPLMNLILAGIAYLFWNLQLNPYLNVIILFIIFFNAALAIFNLAPMYPLDGGRLVRALGWGLLSRPAFVTRFSWQIGALFGLLLLFWGVVLILQGARFSWSNGISTLLFAGLILLPLLIHPAWQWQHPEPNMPAKWQLLFIRAPIMGLFFCALLGLTLSLVPTNNGLEAPGIATDVTPMVEVPSEYYHPAKGRFLLTTVFSQTPITAGQWLFGQLSPIIKLVPPERIVPADSTVQEVAQRNFRMLDNSQSAAIAVGLRLAGYEVVSKGLGVRDT